MGPFAALLPALGAAAGTIGGSAAAGSGTIMGLSAAQAGMLGGALGSGLGAVGADMLNSNQQPGMPGQAMPAPPTMPPTGRFGGGPMIDPNSLVVSTRPPGMPRSMNEYEMLRRLGLV